MRERVRERERQLRGRALVCVPSGVRKMVVEGDESTGGDACNVCVYTYIYIGTRSPTVARRMRAIRSARARRSYLFLFSSRAACLAKLSYTHVWE